MTPELERLHATLGRPALSRLIARLKARSARGTQLSGCLTMQDVTVDEKDALARLLGRKPASGQSVTVDLDTLSRLLREAELAPNLQSAIEALCGGVANERAARERARSEWEDFFEDALSILGDRDEIREWVHRLQGSGLLKRVARGDASKARALLTNVAAVEKLVPFQTGPAMPLAEIAAMATGDSHALDRGTPLSALCLNLGAVLIQDDGAEQNESSTEAGAAEVRREIWARLGVLCDELSSPVLVLNLVPENGPPSSEMLKAMAQAGEPARLSVRQLVRSPPSFSRDVTGPCVYITENPTVVAAAADRLGTRSAPLVCTEGQPKTALHLLLARLSAAGIELRYHGDFDWKGLEIANSVMRRHGAKPWRMGASDYLARPGRTLLKRSPVECFWDGALSGVMQEKGTTLYEEEVLDLLLADLATRA